MAKQRSKGSGRSLLITGLALAGVGVGLGLILANRDKLPANIREFNKRYTNPMMLRSVASGERGNLGVLLHQGRTSGRAYATPVRIDAIPEGFLVPLPYGTNTDWLKNIQAAKGVTVRFQGHDIPANQPEIIDATSALALLPPSATIAARVMRIKHYLLLRRADLPQPITAEESVTEDRPSQ
jgi:deazaflavin-dependent oxidoreductase (nitroreductase family)